MSCKFRKCVSMITVFVLMISLLSVIVNNNHESYAATAASGRTITVIPNGTGDYTSVRDAVYSTKPGDTVVVYGGTYRETVVFPRGGNDESSRITLKAAPGEKAIITGSDIVKPAEWAADSGNVYTLVKDNTYFGDFNPFAEKWMSKGAQYSDFFSCGGVYINGNVLSQVFKKEDVYTTPNSWYADVSGGKTTISVNFNGLDPTKASNSTEINVRKQGITAAWNQGYITIDGLTVMHGSGPKTIDFWQTTAKPMNGAIATNGGYYWIIENNELTQNRGVAIDYGSGSRMLEIQSGGEPELYGHHIIRYNNVHDNGTNGMMAYRGAYTEIYGNTLVNNNALNTGLLSEAYIKNVSGGFGIYIHDNYFYSDQEWSSYPIWMDSECDGSRISSNIIYSEKGNGKGFNYLYTEVNHGWLLFDNNIFAGVGWSVLSASHDYFVNNLWLNTPANPSYRAWPGRGSWGFPGSEGWDGYQRAMRAMVPGTLDEISTIGNVTSRFETYARFNKMFNNMFFDYGPSGNKSELEVSEEAYKSVIAEVYLSDAEGVNPDYSGGSWNKPQYNGLPIAWVEAYKDTVGVATKLWGNEIDYNVYYGGAQKIDRQYATARGYEADKNSKVVEGAGNNYTVTATRDSFKLTLNVDNSPSTINAPAITGSYLGNTTLYKQLGYDFYAPDVDIDFFGNSRDRKNTVVGPFANLKAGTNIFELWPGVRGVELNKQSATMKKGSTVQLTATVTPSSANQSVTWSTYNPDIATVSADGLVTAVGTGTTTIKATSAVDAGYFANFSVTVYRSSDRGGGSSAIAPTDIPAPTPAPDATLVPVGNSVKIKVDTPVVNAATGEAVATVSDASITQALATATADAAGVKTVILTVPAMPGVTAYVLEMTPAVLASGKANEVIQVATDVGTIAAPANMLAASDIAGAQKVGLAIAKVDKANLDAAIQDEIGNRPVVEINLKVDGSTRLWNNPDAPVTVSIPYTPTATELADPEHLTVWYIDETGKAVSVPTGRYDAETGMVVFTTTHFSKYAVAYVNKTFGDIANYSWAKKAIEVMASKGVINGISDTAYAPEKTVKRAYFMLLLVKALGLSAKVDSNFSDVSASTYYAEAVGIAKKLGIATGIGDNKFNPDAEISRQDMMTLIDRAMVVAKKHLVAGTTADMDKFADKGSVAQYAAQSVSTLVRNGIVSGDGAFINPLGNATRAETAVLIYRLYNN